MSGIDYSKWDKLDVSTSESDEERDSGHGTHAPHTTKLSYPSRVVIGPNGATVESMPPPAMASPFRPSSDNSTHGAMTASSSNGAEAVPPTRAVQSAAAMAATDEEEAMDVLPAQLTRNGGREGQTHLWAQSAETVTVSFFVPASTKARHISHFAITTDKSGVMAASSDDASAEQPWLSAQISIDISPDGTSPIHIRKTFRYPIKLDEELLEGCWQLQSLPGNQRVLVVELFKASLGVVGMTLWWDRCFVEDTESIVDTQTIADRKDTSAAARVPSAFEKTWAEAHDMFRARMKERRAGEKS